MFEGLEKIGAKYQWTAWSKIFFVATISLLAFTVFVLVFEPAVVTQPREHRVLNLIYELALIGWCLAISITERRKRRHPKQSSSEKV